MSAGVSCRYLQQVLYIFFCAVIYSAKPQLILRKFVRPQSTQNSTSAYDDQNHFHVVAFLSGSAFHFPDPLNVQKCY
jgi:hypothetical protein